MNLKSVVAVLLFFRIVLSDIAPTVYRGFTLSPYEEKSVSMKNEIVDIYWGDGCRVEATFSLQNEGQKAIDMKIGFPVNLSFLKREAHAHSDSVNRIYDFEFELNGKRLKETDVPIKTIRSNREYWYGWTCRLLPDKNSVKLKYKVRTNSSYGYGWKRNLHYVLYTGKFWNGTIDNARVTVHFPKKVSPEQILSATSPKNFKLDSNAISWEFTSFKPTMADNIHLELISFPVFARIQKYEAVYSDRAATPGAKLEMAEFYAGLAPAKGLDMSAPFAFRFDYFKDTVLANCSSHEKEIISGFYEQYVNKNFVNKKYFARKSYGENDTVQNTVIRVMERVGYYEKVKYPDIYRFVQRSQKLYKSLTSAHPDSCRFWLSYMNNFHRIESGGAHPCKPWAGKHDFGQKQKMVIEKAKQSCRSNKEIDLWYRLQHLELAELPDTAATKNPSFRKNDILVKQRAGRLVHTLSDEEMGLFQKKYDLSESNHYVKSDRKITDEERRMLIELLYRCRYYRYQFCRDLKKLR